MQEPLDFNRGYFNTTAQKGDVLKKYEEIAGEQEREVLTVFRHRKSMTPSEVWSIFHTLQDGCPTIAPITSIRRAITTLTTRGYLIKTDIKRKGLYGRDEYIWELKA